MKKKLSCVLLIDDDEPTNFINSIIVEEAECTEHIQIAWSGQQGLNYLASSGQFELNSVKYPRPDLIFLDINMPGMKGWEFLNRYKKINEGQEPRIVIVMLSTSLNPDDKVRAKDTDEIAAFKSKPLSKEILHELLEEYFEDHL
jgi:CheY-like chemotaxis protein